MFRERKTVRGDLGSLTVEVSITDGSTCLRVLDLGNMVCASSHGDDLLKLMGDLRKLAHNIGEHLVPSPFKEMIGHAQGH